MAVALETIRRVTIQGKSEGLVKLASDLKKVEGATKDLGTVTDQSAAKSLSAEKAYHRQTMALDEQARAQARVAKETKTAQAALNQGLITQEAYAKRVADINKRYGEAAAASQGYSRATQALTAQLSALSAGGGQVGAMLGSIGPGGAAAAAGLGVVVLAMHSMVKAANDLADRSGKMVDFAESTGLSTTALQALKKAGAEVGLDADKITTSFERFSVQIDDVRRNTGALAEALNRIDPMLTREMATTTDLAESWDVLTRARERAVSLEQKNALSRAAFGRGGVGMGRLQDASSEAGGISGLTAGMNQLNVLTDENLKKWDQLKDKVDVTSRAAKDNIASIFTEEVLSLQYRFWRQLELISQEARRIAPLMRNNGAPSGAEPSSVWSGGAVTMAMPRPRPRELDPRFELEMLQKQAAAMGEAATMTQKREIGLKMLAVAGREANLTDKQLADSAGAINEHYKSQALQARIGALGDLATTTEVVTAKQDAINTANRNGANITREETEAILAKTRAMHEASQFGNQLQFERAQVSRDPIEAETAARLRAEYGADYERHMLGAEASLIRGTAQLRETKQIWDQIGSTLFSSMASGDKLAKSMLQSFSSIATKLASQSFSRMMSGGGLFGNQSLGSAQGAAGMVGAGAMGYQSGSPLMGALGGAMAGAAFGPMGMLAGGAIGGIAGLFGQSAQKKQADAAKWQAAIDAVNESNRKALEEQERVAAEQVRIAEEAAQKLEALRNRIASFQDRYFNATTDTSTLAGAIAAFERQVRKEVDEEVKLGGEGLIELERAHYVERLSLLKQFSDRTIEEAKRTAEAEAEAKNQAARSIVDYLLDLNTGANSALSPSQRLSAANQGYSATLALAQGGNVDALNRITKDAEALRVAAQSFYGSSAGYQQILTTIQTQLNALPAVQESTDPVVAQLSQVVSAVNGTTTAVSSGNSLTSAQTLVLNAQQSLMTANNNLTATTNSWQEGLYSLTGQLVTLNTTSANQLIELKNLQARVNTSSVILGGGTAVANNSIAEALNKIAINTSYQMTSNNTVVKIGNYRQGGVIPGYASGGMVGNGVFDRDSVMARYASGGNIMLAGGEGVLTAPATRDIGGRAAVDFINQHRMLPSNDNGATVAELRAMHRTIGSLLSRIASLEEQGNAKIDRNTAATMEQTDTLAREERINARKTKAA